MKSKRRSSYTLNLESNVSVGGTIFVPIPLVFGMERFEDVFAGKNNKTVSETLEHRKYSKFRTRIMAHYSDALQEPLGLFLRSLKQQNSSYYRVFLNKYGDLKYSEFFIQLPKDQDKKGIYAYFVGDQLKYIGRCRDTMKKRINQGYGRINPKNCYIDGQATNCRLNAMITQHCNNVSLWLCPMSDDEEIVAEETRLIRELEPSWNVRR